MILTDTSVVIDYAQGEGRETRRPDFTATCGNLRLHRAELLCGARDAAHRGMLLTLLAPFAQVAIPEAIWDAVGDNLAVLRRQGVTVPFPDVVIATLGIETDVEVSAHDRHFTDMQKVLPRLKLFQEPP